MQETDLKTSMVRLEDVSAVMHVRRIDKCMCHLQSEQKPESR